MSKRYIEKDDAIQALKEWQSANRWDEYSEEHWEQGEDGWDAPVDVIEQLLPADVVEKERYDRLLENSTIIAEALSKYQSADVKERKKGEWLDDGLDGIGAMGIEYRWQKCSCCGNSISKAPMQRFPSFCSNCGADAVASKEA